MRNEEVCEYVELFYKVEKIPPGATAKNYFKKKKRRWCVLSIDLTPVNCRLEHYDKESSWLKNKNNGGQGENLSELSDVHLLDDRDKSHVLQLEFTHCSLFMNFDSKTKLDTWRQKLNLLLDRYTVQLIKCPEQPSRIGIYVLQLSWNQIDVYYVNTPKLAWSWQIPHLRRFNFHASIPDVEVEAGTRSSTGEGHFYFTGVHMRRLFDALKVRVTTPSIPSKDTATPPAVPPPRIAQTTRIRSKSEWATPNKTSLSEVFTFSHRNSEFCLPSDNVFQHSPPDHQLSHVPDVTDDDSKNTDDVTGYVKMHPVGSPPLTSDMHTTTADTTVTSHHLPVSHMHRPTDVAANLHHTPVSHIYESTDAAGDPLLSPTSNTYDMPHAGMENYDVPRNTLIARTVPANSYGSSSGHTDSDDDDRDFMDQWRIEQALQQCPVQLPSAAAERCPLQPPSPQHNSEIPLQTNPSYTPFEITQQANDNYDYIHPSVFKSQATNT